MLDTEIIAANIAAVRAAVDGLDTCTYDTVSEALPRMLVTGLLKLDHTVYSPISPAITDASGIGRYLLFDNADAEYPLSIWIFAIGEGQKTSIHDHRYRGTVTVLSDYVTEKYYTPCPEPEKTAIRACSLDRHRFHTNRDDLDTGFVHQLKRTKRLGSGTSVSLHIYEMAAHYIDEYGLLQDNRNRFITYTKASKPAQDPEVSSSFQVL